MLSRMLFSGQVVVKKSIVKLPLKTLKWEKLMQIGQFKIVQDKVLFPAVIYYIVDL